MSMREIKFRAWHKEQEIMLTVDMISFKGAENGIGHKEEYSYLEEVIDVYPRYEKTHWSDMKDVILMQYTGLKDKNGKEIYEGDLVWHGRLELEHPLQVSIGGYWPTEGDCGWGVHVHDEDGTFVEGVSAFNQDNNLEVIGNIYESPELLK